MSAGFDPGDAATDAVAAELAPDLAAIIGHLVTGAHGGGQPAALTGAHAAALDRADDTLASFHEDALAWAAGPGPMPAWQSWANRLRSRSASWPARWTHRPARPRPDQRT